MDNQDKMVQSDLLKQNPGNPARPKPSTGGPQFGLENKGGWGKKTRGWINKYGSSVVLPIIALFILVGGIYLYTSQKAEVSLEEGLKQSPAAIQEKLADLTEKPISEQEQIVSLTEKETTKPKEIAIKEIVPETRKERGLIIEKAVPGDGVTHLARRALKNYLQDNPQELTNEHKIYIEDYLKDQIGSQPLEIDEEVTFSEDLINEAINASLQLTPEQLKNLEKYSALVAW